MGQAVSEIRSSIMKAVKSTKNVTTEICLLKILRAQRLPGWRRNSRIFGNPDFIYPKIRLALFVDGCFWHGHDCRNTIPVSNKDFWDEKRQRNKKRDRVVNKTLKKMGWNVIRIWECELKTEHALQRKLLEIRKIMEVKKSSIRSSNQ